MPDKECTTSLLELAFAVGQLRANPTKPRQYVGAMSDMLAGWECRKSGDDGKAFDGLQNAIDIAFKGKGDNANAKQVDAIFSEYHSLLLAMGYLDLDQIDQPKRAPVPQVGFKDGTLQFDDFRLSTTGTGSKAFTDYRQVKVAKPAPVTEEPAEPAAPRAPAPKTGRNMFMSQCLADAEKGASQGGERMKNCSAEWQNMDKRKRNTWDKRAAEANAASAETEPSGHWGYGHDKKRRGASRWTPQNARNSILQ